MNAMFLQDLALKIRRGMKGNADRGLSAGGLAYGYKMGSTPGERTVDPDAAKVIVDIFEWIAAGESARSIARRLNAAQIPSPGRGAGWRVNTILGSKKRANGILRNEAYLGRVVFGRQKRVRNPETGRIVMKALPREQWHLVERPQWRIVSADLWERAHARIRVVETQGLHARRRPPRLLSGLVMCGLCGSPMIVKSNDALVCSRHRDLGGCDHDRSIRAPEVEARVIEAVRTALDQPDLVAEFVATYHAERERLRRQEGQRRRQLEMAIAKSQRGLEGLKLRAESGRFDDEDCRQWDGFKARREEARAEIARLPAEGKVININPQAPQVYRRTLDNLAEALAEAQEPAASRARDLIRALLHKVTVYPEVIGGRRRIELAGELRVMVALSTSEDIGDIVGSGGALPTITPVLIVLKVA